MSDTNTENQNTLVPLSLMVKPELREWLEGKKAKNRRSVNAEANIILEAAYSVEHDKVDANS